MKYESQRPAVNQDIACCKIVRSLRPADTVRCIRIDRPHNSFLKITKIQFNVCSMVSNIDWRTVREPRKGSITRVQWCDCEIHAGEMDKNERK